MKVVRWVALVATVTLPGLLVAQDRTLLYDVSDARVSRAIPTWRLDTAWLNEDNVHRGSIFMGQPQVDVIRFSFTGNWALTPNGTLSAPALIEFNQRMNIVNSHTEPDTALYLNNDTDDWTSNPYLGVNGVDAFAWADLIDATRQACEDSGRTVLSVSPFNEPDYGTWQGDVVRLGDVCWQLRNTFGTNFNRIRIYGASVLNPDTASPWYDTLNGWRYLEEGCTHQLAGSFDSYAGFLQNVRTNGDLGANDELHNVMEAMVGAEYGMDVGIWWGSAERARGEFVRASDGQRLAYAEHRPNWTAASVYRGPDSKVQAFVGESERQAWPTTYRFFSRDRDVFYDGHGPQRAHDVTTTGGPGYQTTAHRNAEKVVNITWGDDVPPVIDGRYIVVNRQNRLVMEVEGANSANGANVRRNQYSAGALHQLWDFTPMPSTTGGDYSYFAVTAAHSGKAPDLFNFSYADGADIRQWELPGGVSGVNQQYFLDYIEDGWFHIRNRWNGGYLEIAEGAPQGDPNIRQGTSEGGWEQHWRLIPVGNPVEFVAPAVPTGLSVIPNAVSVSLAWDANVEPDLAGYTVLRSTNAGGPYEIIARCLNDNSFTDKAANGPETWFYVVQAVDGSLNTSGYSAEGSAAPGLWPALVSRHPFDGNTNDVSGNANHPILTMGSPAFMPGQHGAAIDLNGVDQYTMLPAGMLASVTNFTIALWVNWDGGSAWQRILDFGNGPAQNLFLTPSSGGGSLRFAITTGGAGAEQQLNAPALPVGQWRHVAITRSGNVGRLYVNGSVVDNGTITLAPASFDPALNYIGDSQYTADPLFNGRLDELYVYNYALTDDEIVSLMNDQPPPPTTPTTLSVIAAGGTLNVAWPSNYVGSRLESNSVSLTAPGNWFTVPGSDLTNHVALPVNITNTHVFFRLVYP